MPIIPSKLSLECLPGQWAHGIQHGVTARPFINMEGEGGMCEMVLSREEKRRHTPHLIDLAPSLQDEHLNNDSWLYLGP